MFYGKKSDLNVANKFLKSRIQNKDSKIFVCDIENYLTGFIQLYPLFSSTRVSKYWLLNDLFVDNAHRGKGYSKELINEAKRLVLKTNSCGMMLETEINNKIGNSLYLNVGFKVNRLSNFYEWVPN